jgi:hypothetical protein
MATLQESPLASILGKITLTSSAAKFIGLSFVAVMASFVFVGTIHAQNSEPCTTKGSYCLFVSDYNTDTTGRIQLWSDDGTKCNHNFIGKGAGTGEGVSCLSGSTNLMYTASAYYDYISVFDLTTGSSTGTPLGTTGNLGGIIYSLSANSAGTVVYAAVGGAGQIVGLAPVIPPQSPWLTSLYSVTTTNSHDAFVGLNGNVFATNVNDSNNTGVVEFDPTPVFLKQVLPGIPNNPCAKFSDSLQHCWIRLSGTAWDSKGDLWVGSNAPNDNGIFEFDPSGNPLNFTPDPGGIPLAGC